MQYTEWKAQTGGRRKLPRELLVIMRAIAAIRQFGIPIGRGIEIEQIKVPQRLAIMHKFILPWLAVFHLMEGCCIWTGSAAFHPIKTSAPQARRLNPVSYTHLTLPTIYSV